MRGHDMVFTAEYLRGDDWPVAKRESNGADQEAHSLAKFGNKDITLLVLSCVHSLLTVPFLQSTWQSVQAFVL
jgi:hypothetical protein